MGQGGWGPFESSQKQQNNFWNSGRFVQSSWSGSVQSPPHVNASNLATRKKLNGSDDGNHVLETEGIEEEKEGSDGEGQEIVRDGANGSDDEPEVEHEEKDLEAIARQQAERFVYTFAFFYLFLFFNAFPGLPGDFIMAVG